MEILRALCAGVQSPVSARATHVSARPGPARVLRTVLIAYRVSSLLFDNENNNHRHGETEKLKLFMDNLLVVALIAFIVAGIVLLWVVPRYRRMRAVSMRLDRKRALDQDAIRLASAKLKFRNILAKQGQKLGEDHLIDLYGVEVPTDCRPG